MFLNETLAEVEQRGEEEEVFDEDGEEDTPEVVHEPFDTAKLVKNSGWVTIPEDTEPTLTASMVEYEEKYMRKIEDIITNVTHGYKGQNLKKKL